MKSKEALKRLETAINAGVIESLNQSGSLNTSVIMNGSSSDQCESINSRGIAMDGIINGEASGQSYNGFHNSCENGVANGEKCSAGSHSNLDDENWDEGIDPISSNPFGMLFCN